MTKVYVVDNGDMCIFGVFSTKDKAQYVANKLNLELLQGKLQDWPEEDIQAID